MRYALDENGNRIHIDNTIAKGKYFCDICGSPLVTKKGKVRAHHFAHESTLSCHDHWHYDDMSKWHCNWQEMFPEKCREIVLQKDGEKHRADVFIEEFKTVIEFQHSTLSPKEFDERNNFYNSLGYKVVWIFDISTHFNEGKIRKVYNRKNIPHRLLLSWEKPLKTFNNFNCRDNQNDVELYFQYQLDASEDEYLQYLYQYAEDSGIDDALALEDEDYIKEHCDDECRLLKVTWNSDNGFERFTVVSEDILKDEFLLRFEIHSILEFWAALSPTKAVFKNINTNYYVRIITTPPEYGPCFGYFSLDKNHFPNPAKEIYYLDKPEWILDWCTWE